MNRDFVEIEAYCKINIALDIIGLRKDGYHEVKMILQTIPLHDTVTLRRAPASQGRKSVAITSNADWLPQDDKNTAYRAAYLLARDFPEVDAGTEIYIDKKIPRCGGLGGSSTDAAAVLNGMNQLYGLGLSWEKLQSYAARIGADVPFLLRPGAAVATGTGTELRAIEPFREGILLLVNPNIDICTPDAYRIYDYLEEKGEISPESHPDVTDVEQAMKGPLEGLAGKMKNVLEYPAFHLYPALAELKTSLLRAGASAALMSGSGATFFGIFRKEDAERAEEAAQHFRNRGYFTFISKEMAL
ncbi:MAG: 4-(cytidine 5'-diphospho)-2-C-methyl-D-erythritol kinase [Clostridia bacterium]